MIELTTTLLILLSSTGNTALNTVDVVDSHVNANGSSISEAIHHEPITLETFVREYYKDTPILAEISRCESTFRHFNSNGQVLRGLENADDVGLMQINTYYHTDTARGLGYDIHTVEGNLKYGKYLYDRYGTQPWSASKKCWSKNLTELAAK
jgi:hypothetical protein